MDTNKVLTNAANARLVSPNTNSGGVGVTGNPLVYGLADGPTGTGVY